MKKSCKYSLFSYFLFLLILCSTSIKGAEKVKLSAVFKTKARYAIYNPEEKIEVIFRVEGERTEADTLKW